MSTAERKRPPSVLLAAFLLFCFSAAVFGQETSTPIKKDVPASPGQTTANEDFELNIAQKRITEKNFSRSTTVELSTENRGGLRLEVGVGVRAQSIDATLRGIFGRVRFRASLESLRRRIEQTQKADPPPQQKPPLR